MMRGGGETETVRSSEAGTPQGVGGGGEAMGGIKRIWRIRSLKHGFLREDGVKPL